MNKIGLKLWSTNENYIPEVKRLFKKGVFNYIELYTLPKTYQKYIQLWASLDIPYIIHAPHFMHGFNLSQKASMAHNKALLTEVKSFADTLKAKYIIVHPGMAGSIKETSRQLLKLHDKRFLIENKPYVNILNTMKCTGSTLAEIQYVCKTNNIGFCFDIGHAINAANSLNIDPLESIKSFLILQPSLIHLSDGNVKGIIDNHMHLGAGSFNLKTYFSLLPDTVPLTIETDKDDPNSLCDFEQDINIARSYLKNNYEN
jgi:deoxyribonuclease IV